MTEVEAKDKDYPDWWDLNNMRDDKEKWNEGIDLYMNEEEPDASEIDFDE
jgi:hypothetical protein